MITFHQWQPISEYTTNLNQSLNPILEQLDEKESNIVKIIKNLATDTLSKVKSSISNIPDEKKLNTEVPKLLNKLKNTYGKYAKENYDKQLLQNFNFFNQIDHLKEFWSDIGKAILKAIVAVLKWFFTSLANLIKAALHMIKDSVTEEGFFKICVFWVAPAILASPVLGLQAIYGISNLIGLTPFIAWVIWHVFVAPALAKLD
jgi:hypothetical protein